MKILLILIKYNNDMNNSLILIRILSSFYIFLNIRRKRKISRKRKRSKVKINTEIIKYWYRLI